MVSKIPSFESLTFKKKALIPVNADEYCIFTRNGQSVNVRANTAYEAFKLSGVREAIRIERMVNIKQMVLNKNHFSQDDSDIVINESQDIEIMLRSSNPIFSANDMDRLMRSFHHALPSVTDPMGLEVQNDGFDEIIPSNHVNRSANTRKIMPAETEMVETASVPQAVADSEAQALSPEDIEKLLGGE